MNTDKSSGHLFVESGPDKGRYITVPADGARIGRSSSNDIVLTDPSLSRFHCRVFFQDDLLWVGDLGSTNDTVLNHKPVVEKALQPGDVIEIGATVLRIQSNRLDGEVPSAPPPAAPATPPGPVNLGFGPKETKPSRSTSGRGPRLILWILLGAAFCVCAAVLLPIVLNTKPAARQAPTPSGPPPLEISYEKVRADTANIFRYEMLLKDKHLSVRVDNLEDGRHLFRESDLDDALLASLLSDLERIPFYELQNEYEGLAPEIYDSWDLTITVGSRSHHTRVLNRLEPEAFQKTRELLEEFARNELGLAALSLPPEKLLELGSNAILQGRKLLDEQEVRYENLSLAIHSFEEAIWYLESMEPKPEEYPSAVRGLQEARDLLRQRYEEQLFQADRAIKLRDWETASRHLRIICELISDRNDERHKKAADRLLDVERRLDR